MINDLSVFGEELEYEHHIAGNVVRTVLCFVEDRLTSPISDEERNLLEGKMSDAWTHSGPYGLDEMNQLNQLHEQAVRDGTGYSLSFMPNRGEFAIQTINEGLEQTEVKSDSLFEAIMGSRKAMNGVE